MENTEHDIAAEVAEVYRRVRGFTGDLERLPRRDSDPAGTVRIGTRNAQTLYDVGRLRTALDLLRSGAPIGSPENAPDGTVWRALRRAVMEMSKMDD